MEETDLEAIQKYHVEIFEFHIRDGEKRLDYADAFSHAGLKLLFFVNAGSIVSLMTFVGNGKITPDKRGIFWAFFWFSLGILSNFLSYFCAYFCQNYFMKASYADAWFLRSKLLKIEGRTGGENDRAIGNRWIAGAIAAAVLSFVFFVVGAFVALVAIT